MSTGGAMTMIKSHDGCRLAVLIEQNGTGLPVLFSNSLASDHTMWDGVVQGLGRPAIRYDGRGHGQSEAPAGPYDQELLARDALAVLDHYEIDRAIVCGLSLGGLVAGWLAAHCPDRIAGIVLANTVCAFRPEAMWRERAEQARTSGMAQFVAPTLERWFPEPFREDNPDVMATVADMIARTAPEGYAGSCEALAVSDMSDDLSATNCPALVIAGEKDPSATVAQAEAMAALLKDTNLVCLDAAHLSAIEKPDEFRAVLTDFAARVEAR